MIQNDVIFNIKNGKIIDKSSIQSVKDSFTIPLVKFWVKYIRNICKINGWNTNINLKIEAIVLEGGRHSVSYCLFDDIVKSRSMFHVYKRVHNETDLLFKDKIMTSDSFDDLLNLKPLDIELTKTVFSYTVKPKDY